MVRLMQHQFGLEALPPQFAFDELLQEFARLRGSFLHINAGSPPLIRAGDKLLALTEAEIKTVNGMHDDRADLPEIKGLPKLNVGDNCRILLMTR